MSKPQIFVITGPTAVGKTAATVSFAKKRSLSVVSFDSRQFYKEITIGTAKPTEQEMEDVSHFFINSHSIKNPLTAASYEAEAIPVIHSLIEKEGSVVLTGGSGMYLDALLNGIEPKPEIPTEITKKLNEKLEHEGLQSLTNELVRLDPLYASKADVSNPRRVLRALEVIHATGKSYSQFRTGLKVDRPWNASIIILEREREELYGRINKRVDVMIQQGLQQEALKLKEFKDLPVMRTVGYQELFPYFSGEYDLERAIELMKRNTRRYAKRQLTWFKRYTSAETVHPSDLNSLENL